MKVLLKPYTEDLHGHKLMCDIYEVYKVDKDTIDIIYKTINGRKILTVPKNRILKVIKD